MIIGKPYSNPEDEPEYLDKPLLSVRQVMQLSTENAERDSGIFYLNN
jgi:hypothetical protein